MQVACAVLCGARRSNAAAPAFRALRGSRRLRAGSQKKAAGKPAAKLEFERKPRGSAWIRSSEVKRRNHIGVSAYLVGRRPRFRAHASFGSGSVN